MPVGSFWLGNSKQVKTSVMSIALQDIQKDVLASLILSPDLFESVSTVLRPQMFDDGLHRELFDAMVAAEIDGQKYDERTLAKDLTDRGHNITPGEIASFSLDSFARPQMLEAYTSKLIEEYDKSNLQGVMISALHDIDAGTELSKIQADIQGCLDNGFLPKSENTSITGRIIETSDLMLRADSGDLISIKTGINQLDRMLGGWWPGKQVILAARPGMGKTMMALFYAITAARSGAPVLFVSQEMGGVELVVRFQSMLSGISVMDIKRRNLTTEDREHIEAIDNELTGLPIFISEQARDLQDLKNKIRAHKKHGIQLVIFDYLQRIGVGGDSNQNREQELTKISNELKNLCMPGDMNCTNLILSQLSRAVETRGGSKRPILSDLRGSGSIEQDADAVLFIYRDSYYDLNTAVKTIELIVAKHRDGDIGYVDLDYNGGMYKEAEPEQLDGLPEKKIQRPKPPKQLEIVANRDDDTIV